MEIKEIKIDAEEAVKKPNVCASPSGRTIRTKPYYAGIDIIKIIAAFFVVGIHFFLYSGFYNEPVNDTKFMFPIACRWIVFTCVPLFMIATGYLMKNKTLSKGYYLGLVKILVVYVAVSIICMLFNHKQYGTEYTLWGALKGFIEFSNANYGWYINYYICIFALIPFLNLAFNGLKSKKQRLALVVTVTLITVFARSFFLGFERNNQIRLFPDYINGMWPIAYYYAGAFIRQYPPKRTFLSKFLAFSVMAAAVCFITVSTYNHSFVNTEYNQCFESWHFNDYSTYPVFIIAVCIFLLLFDITTQNKLVRFVLKQLSGTTLALYLISYVFDNKYYMAFNMKYPDIFDRFVHSYEIVGKVFLLSLVSGLIINNLYNLAELAVKKIAAKIREEREA